MAGPPTGRILGTAWVAAALWALPAEAQRRAAPQPPEITLAEGTELVSLARTGMHRYIRRRTPAGRQLVPASLKRLMKRPYAAAVTLRENGKLVARDIRGADSLPQNVIAAALRAMRSPGLPDRVSRSYLDTLTIEIEVLGGPRPVAENGLASAIVPGHTGLMLTRGHRSAYSLVSSAIVLGLGPDDMRSHCLGQLGLDRAAAARPLQWATFVSRHYVGYPNGQIKWLDRGKLLVPREVIDENMLAAAAGQAARYLVATQQNDGRYLAAADQPSKAPDESPGQALADHLYATWVLARLLRGAAEKDRPLLRGSVNRALGYAARSVRRVEGAGRAYVQTRDPGNQVAAAALLALALDQAPPAEPGAKLQQELLAALVGAIGKDGRLSSRLDVVAGSSLEAPEAPLKHAALACLAFSAGLGKDSPHAAKAAKFRKALVGRAAARKYPADVETTLWWARSGLAIPSSRSAVRTGPTVFPLPVRAGGTQRSTLRDEIGGFGPSDAGPTTMITALTALQLRAQLAGSRTRPAGHRQELRRQALEARRFCYQMMFKPYEAYFAAKPATWVGAVRGEPASAAVSLRACAAAIEAFLAK